MIGQPAHRRALAAWIGVLTATLPLAIPFMDAGEEMPATRVESHHDPGRCFRHHDHAACAQLLRSFAEPAVGKPEIPERPLRATVVPRPAATRPLSTLFSPLGARAPPA
ncbi:MAG: hypothetical protein ACE5HP_08770 [Gemmatimonadota bacterium]